MVLKSTWANGDSYDATAVNAVATAVNSSVKKGDLFFNVKDYGATGDGTTDDTTAIANAITAAAGSGGAGVVYFPPGNYVTSPITVPGGITLQGANGGGYLSWTGTSPNANTQSQLTLKSGSTSALISPNDSGLVSTYVTINNLWLNCNGINQPAINLPDNGSGQQRNWLIDQCNIYNVNSANTASGYAMYVGQNQSAVTLRDSTIFNGMNGFPTGGASSYLMGYNGLGWYGSDGQIFNLWLGGFKNAGFTALGGANDYTFLWVGGGTFWNNTNVIGGGGFTFVGVSFDHHQNDGVYIGSGSGNVTTFLGCDFHTNSIQTTNTWSHINVAGTSLYVNLIGCRTEKYDSGVTSHQPAYFVNNTGGSTNEVKLVACSDGSGGQLGTALVNACSSGSVPRSGTATSSATPTINTDLVDVYGLTAQTADITSFTTNLTGTPVNGQKLWIYVVGTAARAITWGAKFEAGPVALPTTTVTTQRLDVEFIWNAVSAKWRCTRSGSAA